MSKSLKRIGTTIERMNANTVIARNRAIIANNKIALTAERFMNHTVEGEHYAKNYLRYCVRMQAYPRLDTMHCTRSENKEIVAEARAAYDKINQNAKYTKDSAGVRAYVRKENISATEAQILAVIASI